jgi:hypothetical protein
VSTAVVPAALFVLIGLLRLHADGVLRAGCTRLCLLLKGHCQPHFFERESTKVRGIDSCIRRCTALICLSHQ